jgi:Asp-tRNA(Asn)/Glu-tRNA(Gln) amidotransferase A subunit family amidase
MGGLGLWLSLQHLRPAGNPLPLGWSASGVPIGVQLVGRMAATS